MAFIPIQGLPLITPQVLSQCPSEAEHDLPSSTYPRRKPEVNRTPCYPCEAGHERPMTPQHQSRGGDAYSETRTAGFDSSPVNPGGSKHLDRLTSAISEDSGGRATPTPCAPKMSPKAEEAVRIMEWTKGMVIRAHENGKTKEREMHAEERFQLMLRKWKMDSEIRVDETGDSDSPPCERLEEGKCPDSDSGSTGKPAAASMEGCAALWQKRFEESRRGLGVALERCSRLGVFDRCMRL